MTIKHYHDLIKKPVITEKATLLTEFGKYVFEVSSFATKANIKIAIEKIFDVKVQKVNIINQEGKVKRFRGKIGKRSCKKKALVTLESDQTIDLAGGVR